MGDERKFLGPLMRSARGDVMEPDRFAQKRPRTFVSALAAIAAVETPKHRLSRDFQSRSIFDFCNSIGTSALFGHRGFSQRPLCADIVAKVENRTTLKSRES